jgi:hypothetical protein
MKSSHNWRESAVCSDDVNSNYWLSYDLKDIKYAKEGCSRCDVRIECLTSALSNDVYFGVNGGVSEWDFLNTTWKKAKVIDESNWSRSDRSLYKLLQKAK